MSFLHTLRDKNVIKQAYSAKNARISTADNRTHLAMMRRIGREAAEEGLTLDEAYDRYADYMETLDQGVLEDQELASDDPGVVDELTEEGEDPGNFDDD